MSQPRPISIWTLFGPASQSYLLDYMILFDDYRAGHFL